MKMQEVDFLQVFSPEGEPGCVPGAAVHPRGHNVLPQDPVLLDNIIACSLAHR